MSKVFDLVLGVFREPGLVADMRDKELPESLSLVIRLAAGEGAALQCARDTTGETAETLVDACVFFLQQILFAPGADAYRVLGADRDAPQERLRENYRWLMKWLHPDRNQDGWEAVYADRVTVAWQDLKTPDRRARYHSRSPASQMLAPMTAAPLRRVVPMASAPGGPLLSGSTVRRLPMLVLGALGVAAMTMIGVTYWAQSTTQQELSELRRDRAPSIDTLSTRLDPGPREAPTATGSAAAATSAATAVVRANLDAIAVAVADDMPMAQVPDTPLDVADAGVPVISAAPVVTVAETELVAAAEPAPVATATESVVLSEQPAAAAAPAAGVVAEAPQAVEAEQTPTTGDLPVETGQAAALALTQPVSAAELVSVASIPATPLPTSVERAAQLPAPAASPRQPTSRATQVSRPVVAAKVVETPAQPSPAAQPAASAPRAAPDSPVVATTEVAESSASSLLAVAPPPLPRPAPAQHDAEALVREFASAYAAGDLARFDRLFTSASPEFAALDPMRSRFGSTEMRYLEIEQIGWYAEAEQGRVRAHYRDTYVPRGRRKAVTESGVIEWTIRVDAGDARIASVARNNGGS